MAEPQLAIGQQIESGPITNDVENVHNRDRRDLDATVGFGPGGVTIGPRQRCRMVTTTIQRDDGRTITRRERRCD